MTTWKIIKQELPKKNQLVIVCAYKSLPFIAELSIDREYKYWEVCGQDYCVEVNDTDKWQEILNLEEIYNVE